MKIRSIKNQNKTSNLKKLDNEIKFFEKFIKKTKLKKSDKKSR